MTMMIAFDNLYRRYACPICTAKHTDVEWIYDEFITRSKNGNPQARARIHFRCGLVVISDEIEKLASLLNVAVEQSCSPTVFEMNEVAFRKYVKNLLEGV